MGRSKCKPRRPKPKKKKKLPPPPPWIELPADVTANILQRLTVEDILESAQKVCTTWRKVCLEPSMWRFIDMRNRDYPHTDYDINMMCRHAVDRSQGQLREIHFEYFGNDELLLYIAKRSSHLRRLSLACSFDVSGEGVLEAVKQLPRLEELHLIIAPGVLSKAIEAIGMSCPKLKSFTYNDFGCKYPLSEASDDEVVIEGIDGYNDISFAIGKSMPNLLHLQLFAHYMSNVGLQAILDGCPHLESLDLRQCHRIDLKGDLGKRCFQQIKNLRLPSDSVADYEWDAGESPNADYDSDELYSPNYSDMYYFGSDDEYDDYTNPFRKEYLSGYDSWPDDDYIW